MAAQLHSGRKASQRGEDGYVLLTLLLIIALMIIFAAAIVPSITFDIKRDREEEMIHRGVQYSRAIRAYYKKFGRYPVKLEDLESSNNLRFLRKRYKDPITGQDFKLLHFGEANLAMSGGIGGGSIPGANPIGAASGLNGPGGLSQPSTFGANSSFGGNSTFAINSGFGAASNSSFGQNPQTANNPSVSSSSQPAGSGPAGSANSSGNSGDTLAGKTFGGGPIVGVASTSKDQTIREFNHKKKYSEWQFIYDPAADRGFLITTPYQPQLAGFGVQGVQNVNGQNGTGQSGAGSSFGAGNSFGNSPSGMQNNPNAPATGGFGTPNPPSSPPQQ